MKVVFVAFDCKKENSVMYKKLRLQRDPFDNEFTETDKFDLGNILVKAIEKGADFCSVRFIKGGL